MPKSPFKIRYVAVGDTIPASLPSGDGSPGTKVHFLENDSIGDGGTYAAGTRLVGWMADVTTPDVNRANWCLAESIDHLFEQEVAIPTESLAAAGVGGDSERLVNTSVYLGELGAVAGDIPKVMAIWDANRDEVVIGDIWGYITDIRTAAGGGGFSCYPGAGLPAINTLVATISSVAPGPPANLVLNGAGIPAAVLSTSLMNYSGLLRAVRDGTPLSDNFVTIIAVNAPFTDFDVHRDVQALGWATNDEVYISYFTTAVYLTFNVTVPFGTNYYIVHGEHSFAGQIPSDGILSYAIHGGHKIPYELRVHGLDQAYDRAWLGPAGSGRQITTDSGPVELGGAPVSGAMVRTYSDNAALTGEVSFDHFDQYAVATNVYSSNGYLFRKLMNFADETKIANTGEVATGDAVGVVTLTAGPPANQWRDGATLYNLIPGVDMAWIVDGAGDPVGEGLYVLSGIANQTQALFRTLDDGVCNLTTMAKIFIYRPIVSLPGRTLIGVSHAEGAVFTAYNNKAASSATRLFSTVNGTFVGHFTQSFIGDISIINPVHQQLPIAAGVGKYAATSIWGDTTGQALFTILPVDTGAGIFAMELLWQDAAGNTLLTIDPKTTGPQMIFYDAAGADIFGIYPLANGCELLWKDNAGQPVMYIYQNAGVGMGTAYIDGPTGVYVLDIGPAVNGAELTWHETGAGNTVHQIVQNPTAKMGMKTIWSDGTSNNAIFAHTPFYSAPIRKMLWEEQLLNPKPVLAMQADGVAAGIADWVSYGLWPRAATKGITDSGTGTTGIPCYIHFGDYEYANEDRGRVEFTEYDFGGGDAGKIAIGMRQKNIANRDMHFVLRETPTAAGTAGLETPTQTITDNDIEDRFEVEKQANIGWDAKRTLIKLINLANMQPLDIYAAGGAHTNGAWELLWTTGVPEAPLWVTDGTIDQAQLMIPIEVPHGATIEEITVFWQNQNALNPDGIMAFHKRPWAGTLGAAIASRNDLDSIAGLDYTLAALGEKVNLETHTYYLVIQSGTDGAVGWRRLINCKVMFTFVDIFPQ